MFNLRLLQASGILINLHIATVSPKELQASAKFIDKIYNIAECATSSFQKHVATVFNTFTYCWNLYILFRM